MLFYQIIVDERSSRREIDFASVLVTRQTRFAKGKRTQFARRISRLKSRKAPFWKRKSPSGSNYFDVEQIQDSFEMETRGVKWAGKVEERMHG